MILKEIFFKIEWNLNQVLIAGVLCLIIIKFLLILWGRRHLYRLSYQLDGGFSWPIVGHLFEFVGSGEKVYKMIHDLAEKHESPVKKWLGPVLLVFVYDADDIQIILRHENSSIKPFMYQYARDWVGDGILLTRPQRWKKHRKIIAPTFNRSTLNNYLEIFKKQSDIFVQQVQKYSNSGKHFNVFGYVARCTLDMILESAMGVDISAQTSSIGGYGDQYMKSSVRAFEIFFERSIKIWYYWDRIFKLSSLSKELRNCVNIFDKVTDKVIEEKRRLYEKENSNNETENIFDGNSNKSFIDELFKQLQNSNSEWTNKDVRDEVSTMIAAGSDTTAHALSFVILLLAMHPDIQEKVYEEIKHIDSLIENPDYLNIDMANKMVYMNQVIMESQRVFATAPIVCRYTTGVVKLKSKNIVIPKGAFFVLGISMLHRSKKFWGPNPHKFDPDNFSPENRSKRHPNSFIPFSDGPRNCVGFKFAILSMKIALYKILKSYKLETDEKFEDICCEYNVLAKKKDGWNIKISARNQ